MVSRGGVLYPLAYIYGVIADSFEILGYHHKQYRLIGGIGVFADKFHEVALYRFKQFVYAVVALVKTQHEKAKKILTENRSKLDVLAQYLYEKETITGEEFMAILEREEAKA